MNIGFLIGMLNIYAPLHRLMTSTYGPDEAEAQQRP